MTQTPCPARLAVCEALKGHTAVGIAVSGGSDSTALLHLAALAAVDTGCRIAAVTVDHDLRAGSAAEAAQVASYCDAQGISHTTLVWQHGTLHGNLQAAARAARYALMAEWAQAQGLGVVLLGHTQDDQAETFLMRLGREAGLDGLTGMAARFSRNGMAWHRPLLGLRRDSLRDHLRAAGLGWSDDPSNADARFDRIKAREALAALAPLGIEAAGLSRVMAQLDDARIALRHLVGDVARATIRQEQGDLILDWVALSSYPPEVARRCLVEALVWMSGAPYPPRREEVAQLMHAMVQDGQRTLSGCVLRREGRFVRLSREAQAVQGLVSATDAIWDGRWRCEGPHDAALHITLLGEAGLRQCPDWRETGQPRRSLLSSPAIWAGETLVAAPLAGLGQGWTARIVADFHDRPVSH
ncbi:MAG: tRNA lysidine(34) synthetase TilS [Rhodobacterales bacterium]